MRRANKRNANGLGSVFQRKNGRWVAVLPADPRTGKRREFTAKTQGEAISKRDEARRHIERFGALAASDPTIEAYLRQWLNSTCAPRVTTRTLDSYRSKVEMLIIPAIGKLRLSKVKPDDVRRMMVDIVAGKWGAVKGKRSPRTANYARIVLRKALDDARRDEVITGNNAAALADKLPEKRKVMDTLSRLELDQLCASLEATGNDLRVLIVFAALTAVRLGEALGVRWSDLVLDGDTPSVTIRLQLQDIKGPIDPATGTATSTRGLVPLKTDQSRRTLHLTANLVSLLRAHKARQATRQLELGALWQNRLGLVFVDDAGRPLAGHRVTRAFQASLATAGIKRVRFHDLRHGALSLMLEATGDLKGTSSTAGHSTIAMMDTYAHVRHKTIARVMGSLADIGGPVVVNTR